MDEKQTERAEKMKAAIYQLNLARKIAKRQTDFEMGEAGDIDRAGDWNQAGIHAIKALMNLHQFCELVYMGGVAPNVMADVVKFAAELKQFDSEPMTRQ